MSSSSIENQVATLRRACLTCRKRKLKCDKGLPRCSSCRRLGHNCAYAAVQPPHPHPRRRAEKPQVQRLESRLRRVEVLLQTNQAHATGNTSNCQSILGSGEISTRDPEDTGLNLSSVAIQELENIYFTIVYPSIPIIHRARYMASKQCDGNSPIPIYLRYAIWAMAAFVSDAYFHRSGQLYQKARKGLHAVELATPKKCLLPVEYAQAWVHIAMYELIHGQSDQAWMTTSHVVRIVQMMGLHNTDCSSQNVMDCFALALSWTELEERRRLFWMAFCLDRYACVADGLPTSIDERDIRVRIPVSDEAYQSSTETEGMFLADAIDLGDDAALSPLAALVVVIFLGCSKLEALQRLDPSAIDKQLGSNGWLRNDQWNSALMAVFCIPKGMAVDGTNLDVQLLYLNMVTHCATICVNLRVQEHIRRSSRSNAKEYIQESNERCFAAAAAICELLRFAIRQNKQHLHPFTSFCLYNALVVYAELWTSDRNSVSKKPLKSLINFLDSLQYRNTIAKGLLEDVKAQFPTLLDDPVLRPTGLCEPESLQRAQSQEVTGLDKYPSSNLFTTGPNEQTLSEHVAQPGDIVHSFDHDFNSFMAWPGLDVTMDNVGTFLA